MIGSANFTDLAAAFARQHRITVLGSPSSRSGPTAPTCTEPSTS
jgi:hypothetical protein